jgi:hypothetical protein
MQFRPGLGVFDKGMAAFLGDALRGFLTGGVFKIQGRSLGLSIGFEI